MTENGGSTIQQNICELVPNYMAIFGHRRQNLTSHAESKRGFCRNDFAPHYDLITFFRTIAILINRKQTCSGGFKELLHDENDKEEL